jgi:hypothetical protein
MPPRSNPTELDARLDAVEKDLLQLAQGAVATHGQKPWLVEIIHRRQAEQRARRQGAKA